MISLDYSQSYDRMNVQATLDFLQRIHWPPALLSQTPLTLATWMSSGATAVQSLMQSEANVTAEAARQAVTRIYMDDRSWIDSNYDRALQRATQWHTWSARVGLRESLEKIQACAKPSRLQDILRQDRPDWTIQDTVKVLGVSLRPKRMANTRLEQGRLHSSLRRAKILSCLPVPYHRKTELYCMFVVPKALYGWIVRFPTKADSNKIFNALSRMTGTNRMANPLIRSIIYGGACHLQILLAIRLFKCLCRMRCRGTAVWTNVPGTPSRKFRWLAQRLGLARNFTLELATQCSYSSCPWARRSGCILPSDSHGLATRAAQKVNRWQAPRSRGVASPYVTVANENRDGKCWSRSSSSHSHDLWSLQGSVVSPAWMGRAHADEDPLCPWRTRTGNFLHIAWQCRAFPLSASRPIKPSSWLLSRFGWPQTSTSSHQQKSFCAGWLQCKTRFGWWGTVPAELLVTQWPSEGLEWCCNVSRVAASWSTQHFSTYVFANVYTDTNRK